MTNALDSRAGLTLGHHRDHRATLRVIRLLHTDVAVAHARDGPLNRFVLHVRMLLQCVVNESSRSGECARVAALPLQETYARVHLESSWRAEVLRRVTTHLPSAPAHTETLAE